jgi:hypothetical protein
LGEKEREKEEKMIYVTSKKSDLNEGERNIMKVSEASSLNGQK